MDHKYHTGSGMFDRQQSRIIPKGEADPRLLNERGFKMLEEGGGGQGGMMQGGPPPAATSNTTDVLIDASSSWMNAQQRMDDIEFQTKFGQMLPDDYKELYEMLPNFDTKKLFIKLYQQNTVSNRGQAQMINPYTPSQGPQLSNLDFNF